MKKRTLFTDIGEIMTLEGAVLKKARGPMNESDLSIKKKSVMIVEDKKIVWIGEKAKIPKALKVTKEVSLKGKNVFPGFIDCHTHSLFLGDRSGEFEKRNQGISYQEIAAQGGGILSTVRETRKGKSAALKNILKERLDIFLKQGVTSVEVKSGYGLSLKEEIKLLKVIKDVSSPVKVMSTFLGAHALSPEASSYEEYLKELKVGLQEIAKKKLATRVDIFVEKNYFSIDQARDYLRAAKILGFEITIHADQLTRTGASILAMELEAVSADHAICVTDDDIFKIAQSELTCVLLPAADFYIHSPYPPARKMIDHGVRVALSTDFNPGTSPTQNIDLVGLLARLEMRMTLPEVFVALTLGGAYALKCHGTRGALLAGFDADFFVSDKNYKDFFYDLGMHSPSSVWVDGFKKV